MKRQLFISTSPSDFDILKQLVVESSKIKKVDFLILFSLSKDELSSLKKSNIKAIVKDLKFKNKNDKTELVKADLDKINKFYSNFLLENEYDHIIILGDRYELLPIVQISYLFKKIIMHIHGGEITKGSWDDSIRHSISKLSHIHFVTSENSKKNLIKMGENERNIFNFGSLGAFNAKEILISEKKDLFNYLEIEEEKKTCLLVIQPITNKDIDLNKLLDNLVQFLIENEFKQILISKLNSDPGSKEILNYFKGIKTLKVKFLEHLGFRNYISLAKHSDLVIGNSSSFIFELPMKNIKSILITDRQKGRELGEHNFESSIKIKDLNSTYKNLISKKTTINSLYYVKNTPQKISNKINKIAESPPKYRKTFNNEK